MMLDARIAAHARSWLRGFPLFALLVAGSPATAQKAPGADAAVPTRFVRVVEDAAGRPDSLQVAIVTYSGRTGTQDFTVDLVSAVHVADRAYYAALNDRFRVYDALLYELIVPGEPEVSQARAGGTNLVSGTQTGLKNLLGLSFQLDEIDYGAGNFVHADLNSDMLAQSMAERGESLYVYFWRLLYAAVDDYTRDPLGLRRTEQMSNALSAGPRNALKVTMAYEMVDATRDGDILAGENGSAVIDGRNAHAVRVLREQLEGGARRVAIFYGAAHMPDFERRLIDDLSATRASIEWVDAWRLGRDVPPAAPP